MNDFPRLTDEIGSGSAKIEYSFCLIERGQVLLLEVPIAGKSFERLLELIGSSGGTIEPKPNFCTRVGKSPVAETIIGIPACNPSEKTRGMLSLRDGMTRQSHRCR